MEHLCYGTFCKVLLLCSLANQKELHEALLIPLVGIDHPLVDESRASKLFNCNAVIPKRDRNDLKKILPTKLDKISQALKDALSTQIRDSMSASAAAAIRTLICEDKKIPDNLMVDYVRNTTKNDLKQGGVLNEIDFLVGTFLFTFIDTENNIGKEATYAITSDFIEQAYEEYRKSISVDKQEADETALGSENTFILSPNKPALNGKYADRIVYNTDVYQRLTDEISDIIDDISEMSSENPRLARKREQLSMLQHELEEFEQAVLKIAKQILESPVRTELSMRVRELMEYGECEGADEVIAEIERAALPLLLTVGVHNGVDAFVRHISAKPGEEIFVQMSFRNIGGVRLDNVAGRVVLPNALKFVRGSAKIYNRTNPDGVYIDDGITEEYVGLGGYGEYDSKGRGSGSVSFKAKVTENLGLFVPGVNTLNIVCQVCGYIEGLLSADASVAYTTVHITIER